jgi:hypothetical protein
MVVMAVMIDGDDGDDGCDRESDDDRDGDGDGGGDVDGAHITLFRWRLVFAWEETDLIP